MRNTVIRYGLYGLFVAMILFSAGLYFGKGMDMESQEVVGYITMVASLSFVFLGVKHYRDALNGGKLSFQRAVLLGLLIAVFVAAGIAIADLIYTTFINPDFFTEYSERLIADGYKGEVPDYGRVFMAVIMFLTVMIIGLIISLISALIYQHK